MRGLKPGNYRGTTTNNPSRIFYRCVDWNRLVYRSHRYRWSHLLQMRGLKPGAYSKQDGQNDVASFTDAWIETKGKNYVNERNFSRIFYRCVDWNRRIVRHGNCWTSRIFYRCVDWNPQVNIGSNAVIGRIFYRCVDWNKRQSPRKEGRNVASFTDAWIETLILISASNLEWSHLLQMRGLKHDNKKATNEATDVASFTDAWIETNKKVVSL